MMRLSRRTALLAVAAALLVLPAKAGAVGLQKVGDFEQPIFVTSDPSNPNRIFVVEREGRIKLIAGGATQTFADITAQVRCCISEQGLFSVALAPDFPETGLLYVFYTGEDGPGNLHIAELRASGDSAPSTTLRNLLTIPHASAANHNGGQLQFGQDGFLYAATGDGGNTPQNGQNTASLLGKLLRIDPTPSGGQPYTVPASNPFAGSTPGADEIWAYGLRNPFRFSFDSTSGDLLLSDVGQNTYEEANFAPTSAGLGRGANYGWACREGAHPFSSVGPCAGFSGYTDPFLEYSHAGGGCSITGGYVARDPTLGNTVGRYLYADLCLGEIRSVIPGFPGTADRSEGASVQQPVSFGEDACGRLYVAEAVAEVFRLTGSGNPACRVLTVSKRGQGVVKGPGIKCPPDCTEVFPLPKRVTLKASPRKRDSFRRWRRACSGQGGCSVLMNRDRSVVARFAGPLKTRVKLTAADRSVTGARASLRVKARPCDGRRRDRVKLLKNGKRVAVKRLNRRCVARFAPRVGEAVRFRAKVIADRRHRAGRSAAVRIVSG